LSEIARAARDAGRWRVRGISQRPAAGRLRRPAAVGYLASAPLFRRAIAMLRADDLSPQEGLRWLGLGCIAAADLWDDQAQHALAIRWFGLPATMGR
jgi:hypothetical protein